MGRRFRKTTKTLARLVVLKQASQVQNSDDSENITPSSESTSTTTSGDPANAPHPLPTHLQNIPNSNNKNTAAHDDDEEDFQLEAEEDRKQSERKGQCLVAEQGEFQRRHTPALSRFKSRMVLQANRFAIFTSPEFKRRVHKEHGVPASFDPVSSPLGLLWTTWDPGYRQQCMEADMWKWTDGFESKGQVRDALVEEARRGYERDMRRGRYSIGSSKLGQSVTTRQSPVIDRRCPKGVGKMSVRRSKRLMSKGLQPKVSC